MTLSKRFLVSILVLPMPFSVMAKNGAELTCSPSAAHQEAIHLKQAPHGAKRLNKHSVEVRWQGNKQVFNDKPPYDEPLDGVRWTYCGYNARVKMHLLEKVDGEVFTGAMLDDESGALLPAGNSVLFSPDFKYYLAYEQENGRDGATLKLYRRNGTLQWEGYDGILTPDGTTIVAFFEKTYWNEKGRLQASATCLNDRKAGILTLTPKGNGQWQWMPKVRC